MSHIGLLIPDLEAGGAERVMLLLAKEFAVRGHHVDLILLRAVGPLLDQVPADVHLIDLAVRKHGLGQLGFAFFSLLRLASSLKRERPDVLLSTLTGTNLVALLARRIFKLPVKVVIREAVTFKNISAKLRLRAMRWLYPGADAVIALSEVMANELKQITHIPAEKIYCIRNPVDTALIRSQAGLPVEHHWLNDATVKVIISVGRLSPQKDYSTLLYAFSLLPSESQARLIILGDGPERTKLEKLATEIGIGSRVQFIGFDKNPWRWMSRSRLFAMSSQWEGHPNALLEAITLGLPVVATEYDKSITDIFDSQPLYQRRIVPPRDPKKLSRAIEELLNSTSQSPELKPDPFNKDSIDKYEKVLLSTVTNK